MKRVNAVFLMLSLTACDATVNVVNPTPMPIVAAAAPAPSPTTAPISSLNTQQPFIIPITPGTPQTPTPSPTPTPTPSLCPWVSLGTEQNNRYVATLYSAPDVTYPTETDTVTAYLYIDFTNDQFSNTEYYLPTANASYSIHAGVGDGFAVSSSSADHSIFGYNGGCNYTNAGISLTNLDICPTLTITQPNCPAAQITVTANFASTCDQNGCPAAALPTTAIFTYSPIH